MPDLPNAQPTRRNFLVGAGLATAAVAGGGLLTSCRGAESETGGRTGEAAEKLFFAGLQWGTPTHFNPLGTSPGWPTDQDNCQYVYESLLRFNMLDGKLEPGLGAGLEKPEVTKFVVPVTPGATWHDGKPVTADDVLFTFDLARQHDDLSYAVVWDYLSKVEKTGSDQVTFHLNRKRLNPRMVEHYLAQTWVLPQHVWEPIAAKGSELRQYENTEPVGSGPYRVNTFDQTQIELKRHEKYWGVKQYGGLPKPKFLNHPIFKGNQDGDLAFERNRVDVSQQFTPQIWKMWADKGLPVGTWMTKRPYHLPGNIPMLMFNHTKKGLDNPLVRRALAFAINYEQIAKTAMSRYSDPVQPSLILPDGAEKPYFDAEAVKANGWRYDPTESVRILEEDLKAKKGGDGIYRLPDGTRLGPWTAQTPTGWTDWQSALRVVASSAREVGIQIRTEFPQDPVVTQAMNNGSFEIAVWSVSGVSAASPWERFRDALESRGVPRPGKEAFWNYGRFHSPAAEKLLDQAAAAEDDEGFRSALAQLDELFREQIPMIPLVYRPLQFFSFNEATWTGFPTEKDPYAPPTFQGAGNAWLFKLKPASGGKA